jgi:type IV pilus assembly protein PilX
MRTQMKHPKIARHGRRPRGKAAQAGATLIVGLVLLLVLTVLGVSTMNTATLEVTMAGNTQFQQDAFQAAETGIDLSISRLSIPGPAADPIPVTPLGDGSYFTQASKSCVTTTPVPHGAFSGDVVQAWHFDITATGTGPRNAAGTHTQSFYIIGPAAGTCP